MKPLLTVLPTLFKLSVFVVFLSLLSGCFFDDEALIAQETLNVESGDEVEVYAREGGKKYRWKQLSGVNVVIANKRSSVLKFTAPTVTEKTDLVFKLNAKFDDPIHDQITISVYPILIINGLRLPPEPNEEENNATLVGIDSNDNGVRDDVERAIYIKYEAKVKQEFAMQNARAGQSFLEDPNGVENAAKWQKIISTKSISCKRYLRENFNIQFKTGKGGRVSFIENQLYNNKDRVKKYLRFNHALGGGVYGGDYTDSESACEFNVPEALGLER
jgi:hypothetical protein